MNKIPLDFDKKFGGNYSQVKTEDDSNDDLFLSGSGFSPLKFFEPPSISNLKREREYRNRSIMTLDDIFLSEIDTNLPSFDNIQA